MSRKNRLRRQHREAAAVEALPVPSASSSLGLGGFGGGYQGAAWSMDRGYVYWPTLDPRREIDTYSKTEIARKVHWLCANVGLARRLREGLTNLIVGDGLSPQARTKDAEWNELAEKAYWRRASSALSYSVNGRDTGVQMQRKAVRTALGDGDAAIVFSKSESGGALRALYSGLQIGNTWDQALTDDGWSDGLKMDSLDRVIAYRLLSGDGEKYQDLPASSVRFLSRSEAPGAVRGISAFAHAVNKMIDITELNTALVQGIKSASRIGYYITAGDEKTVRTMQGAIEGKKTTIETAAGPINLKQVYGSGGNVPCLPKDADLKMLLDQRPHPNSREFVEDLIRDISWGSGISSDLLWNIYKLGGANTRFVLADAQVFVQVEQQALVDTWLSQDWIYTIACEMKAGRLRRCKDPEWWVHGWVPPARMTVDYGRDGKIYLEWYKTGLLTAERFFAMNGQDAKEEASKDLNHVAWYKKEMERLGVTWDDLRMMRGITGSAPAVTSEPDPADGQEKDDPTETPADQAQQEEALK